MTECSIRTLSACIDFLGQEFSFSYLLIKRGKQYG